MHRRVWALVWMGVLLANHGFAKDKASKALPPYVLHARTVAVVIDPDAGVSLDDPQANRIAQKDVESALLSWGRFEPVLATHAADLIIVLRKGNGRLVNETVPDARQSARRPGVITPTEDGVSIGAQQGHQPDWPGEAGPGAGQGANQGANPRTEIGQTEDSFLVFEGSGPAQAEEGRLNGNPGWRYVGRDGLHPHDVPAVAAFRKAIAEAEKAAAKTP